MYVAAFFVAREFALFDVFFSIVPSATTVVEEERHEHTGDGADDGGRAVFAIDQPSAVVASLHSDAITDVGRELDAKVLALLEHLHVNTSERQ